MNRSLREGVLPTFFAKRGGGPLLAAPSAAQLPRVRALFPRALAGWIGACPFAVDPPGAEPVRGCE